MSREKQIEEMNCKKCLHYEMCLDNFRKAKEEGLWELTDEKEYFAHADECDFCAVGYCKQSEWISVEERLPEEEGKTVLYYDGADVDACLFYSEHFYTIDLYESDRIDGVTHWMPLPEPPKMKGGAE